MPTRYELGRFVETTSMKGVGRAYKSPLLTLRIIWGLSVCLFMGLAIYQTYELLSDYLHFPTVTDINRVFIESFIDTDSQYQAPDLTLCNLNPYSTGSFRNYPNIPTILNYIQTVSNYTEDSPCTKTATDTPIVDILRTTEGYYQYIGKTKAQRIGHQWEDFIISCHMEIFDGFTSIWRPCNALTNATMITEPRLFNCYSLKVQDGSPLFVAGYSLVLHLDNFSRDRYDYFTSQNEYSRSLGGALVPHMSGTKAWLERNVIHLIPGAHTDVKLHLTRMNRLKPRYGSCDDRTQLMDNPQWNYSVKACLSGCLEGIIARECGCNDVSMMSVLEDVNGHLPFCLAMYPDICPTVAYFDCATKTRLQYYTECHKKCPSMCSEMKYDWDASVSYWPTNLESDRFYKSYIENRSYELAYSDLYAKEDLSEYRDAVLKNFVSFDVYISDFDVLQLDDVVKTSFFSLLSSLGAALNLWAGITVVLFVELLEVLIRIVVPTEDKIPKECKSHKDGMNELPKVESAI